MQLLQMILMLIKRTTFWIVTILIWDETLVLHGGSHHVFRSSSLVCVVELLATFFAEVWDHLLVVRVIYRILTPRNNIIDTLTFDTHVNLIRIIRWNQVLPTKLDNLFLKSRFANIWILTWQFAVFLKCVLVALRWITQVLLVVSVGGLALLEVLLSLAGSERLEHADVAGWSVVSLQVWTLDFPFGSFLCRRLAGVCWKLWLWTSFVVDFVRRITLVE